MENKTFEEALTELEETLKKLESGNIPLEKAIDEKYIKDLTCKELCNKLNNATAKVNKILEENGELKDFAVEDNQ